MSNYVQFPTFGSGPMPSQGQFVNPSAQPVHGQAGPGGYAAAYSMPTSQSNPAVGQSQQPITEGTQAYMNVRLQDGTASYAPVIARMVGGRLEWMPVSGAGSQLPSAGTSPGSGLAQIPTQTGGYGGQLYGDMYRADPVNAKYDKKTEKEMLRTEKQRSKKAREWERDQRAREEAEAKQRAVEMAREAERERVRKVSTGAGYPRDRRLSNAGPQPSGILHRAPSAADLDRRFGNLSMDGAYPATGATLGANTMGNRARRLSVAEPNESAFQRARRQSVSSGFVAPDGNTGEFGSRSRKVSYGNGSATPASAVGAFYPDRERALGTGRDRGDYDVAASRSPGYTVPGALPHGSYVAPDGSGRVMAGPGNGQLVLQGGGSYGATSPYAGQQALAYPHGATVAPPSFYREPSRMAQYTRFEPFSIVWDINDLRKFMPPLPALLVPSDVLHDDWNRCMQDIASAWSGMLPYDLFPKENRRKRQQMMPSTPASTARPMIRPSAAVAKTIDIWNAAFFYGRKLDLILYRGVERRSGISAGKWSERLRLEMIPPQYADMVLGRRARRSRRTTSDDDDSDSDNSSLTSSSTSEDSDSGAESVSDPDDVSEDEPPYVTQARQRERRGVGASQFPQTPYPASRSRRGSLAAQGALMPAGLSGSQGVDLNEMWAVKSREAMRIIRSQQKVERKRRKLLRRQRKRELNGEPLYSLWMTCR